MITRNGPGNTSILAKNRQGQPHGPPLLAGLRAALPMLVLVGEALLYPFYIVFIAKTLEPTGELENLEKLDFALLLLATALGLTLLATLALGLLVKGTLTGRAAVTFMQHRHMRPAEVPGFMGLVIPLFIVWVYLSAAFVFVALRLFFITVPIYLLIRWRTGKGLRALARWWFKLMGRIAVRLRRMNYLGYLLPLVGSAFIANLVAGANHPATPQSTYVVICFQLTVLLVLFRPLGKAYQQYQAQQFQAYSGDL